MASQELALNQFVSERLSDFASNNGDTNITLGNNVIVRGKRNIVIGDDQEVRGSHRIAISLNSVSLPRSLEKGAKDKFIGTITDLLKTWKALSEEEPRQTPEGWYERAEIALNLLTIIIQQIPTPEPPPSPETAPASPTENPVDEPSSLRKGPTFEQVD